MKPAFDNKKAKKNQPTLIVFKADIYQQRNNQGWLVFFSFFIIIIIN